MANHVLLDNINHKDLKIIKKRGKEYGDSIPSVITFPFEFRDIITHYPICFSKDPKTGKFYSIALFGFEDNENLFLNDNGWDASYIPLMLEREPFLIGTQTQDQNNNESQQRVVYVDMDSNRVSFTEGQYVFLEQGGNSEYLNRISSILEAVYQAQKTNEQFFDSLTKLELIEPFVLDVKLDDQSNNKLTGFYTINEEKLNSLPTEALSDLLKSGMLESIYMVIASFSNFRVLIEKKNKQRLNDRGNSMV